MTRVQETLLSVQDVSVQFGGVRALDSVTFSVTEGSAVGLIGPNGAGKTTLFNVISRLVQPSSGALIYAGQNLLDVRTDRLSDLGIARTFQNLSTFESLTVLENVLVGAFRTFPAGMVRVLIGSRSVRRAEAIALERAMEILELVGLGQVAHAPAGSLPFGLRKRLELARALATEPRLLMLDEPANGLNHEEVEALRELIAHVQSYFNVTLLVVEHHMPFVNALVDELVVLNFGSVIASGDPTAVRADRAVIEAYLGVSS